MACPTIAFKEDVDNFITHQCIKEEIQTYLNSLLDSIQNAIPELEEKWFSYWPKSYSTAKNAFIEFTWECYLQLGQSELADKRTEEELDTAIKAIKSVPKEIKETLIDNQDKRNPKLVIVLHDDICHEPWEEGSIGYDL